MDELESDMCIFVVSVCMVVEMVKFVVKGCDMFIISEKVVVEMFIDFLTS